jgi:hypothetical protein
LNGSPVQGIGLDAARVFLLVSRVSGIGSRHERAGGEKSGVRIRPCRTCLGFARREAKKGVRRLAQEVSEA